MKRTLLSALFAITLPLAPALFAAGDGAATGCALELPPPTPVELSDTERSELLRMREEEKLARDLYLHFHDLWGLRPFSNIAAAEQSHMDRMLEHIVAQGLTDPAAPENGRFNLPEIQTLYDTLAERGTASAEEALGAAAYVEEIDILDLQRALSATDDPDQRLSYVHLMVGSYKHLQAFVRQLTQRGVSYRAQLLPQEQVEWILAGDFAPNGRAAVGFDGAASGACFIPLWISEEGRSGEGLLFSAGEGAELVVEMFPGPAHEGRPAELIAAILGEGGDAHLLDEQGRWRAWNGRMDTLVPLRLTDTLAARERLDLYHAPVLQPRGDYRVYVGYVLDDGGVVASGAMRFSVR